jgi:hypothetical protein
MRWIGTYNRHTWADLGLRKVGLFKIFLGSVPIVLQAYRCIHLQYVNIRPTHLMRLPLHTVRVQLVLSDLFLLVL